MTIEEAVKITSFSPACVKSAEAVETLRSLGKEYINIEGFPEEAKTPKCGFNFALHLCKLARIKEAKKSKIELDEEKVRDIFASYFGDDYGNKKKILIDEDDIDSLSVEIAQAGVYNKSEGGKTSKTKPAKTCGGDWRGCQYSTGKYCKYEGYCDFQLPRDSRLLENKEDEKREIELDEEKIKEIIHNGIEATILNYDWLGEEADIETIKMNMVKALNRANIIKVKEVNR